MKSHIEKGQPPPSVRRQAQPLNVNRNRLSSKALELTPEEVELCREINKLYLDRPLHGALRILTELQSRGFKIDRGVGNLQP